jgi:hypothetical protein
VLCFVLGRYEGEGEGEVDKGWVGLLAVGVFT